jgi:hypothetical protein
VPQTPSLRLGILPFLPAPKRRSSIRLIAIQPSISTIPCKCLYSIANPMLPSPMFSATTLPKSYLIRCATIFGSRSSFIPNSSLSRAQILPTFSTVSKHRPHRNARISTAFRRLHHSLCIPGGGGLKRSKHTFAATLTSHQNPNPCVCNVYKKHGGIYSSRRRLSARRSARPCRGVAALSFLFSRLALSPGLSFVPSSLLHFNTPSSLPNPSP